MKKIFSVFLALVMALGVMTVAFADTVDPQLQFGSDGKFKILVLADFQEGYPVKQASKQFVIEALDKVQPDIVVLLGDNLYQNDLRIIDELVKPMQERGIPFTFVFGNHDRESAGVEKEEQLKYYQRYSMCLAYDADPALHGCATHNLPVLSSDGGKVAFNMWLFDSGDYIESGEYDCVRKDQIDWYKQVSDRLAAENGGNVPSIAFEHIIPGDVADVIYSCKAPFDLGYLTVKTNNGKKYLAIPNAAAFNGVIYEPICPSPENDGQWDAMAEQGDVMAVVTGHDHVNDFTANVKGVDILQTPTCGYNSYHNYGNMGARVITIDENEPFEYDQYMLYAYQLAKENGSKLYQSEGAKKIDFILGAIEHAICYGFSKICSVLFGWLYGSSQFTIC
ncbi:MAG: metallophosphoesterase [Clostridiales bacterium]|nr:metallophosphoesterase [Clostridiales bacterium]